MTFSPRSFPLLPALGACAVLAVPAGAARAQDNYPAKPVRIVVQY